MTVQRFGDTVSVELRYIKWMQRKKKENERQSKKIVERNYKVKKRMTERQ